MRVIALFMLLGMLSACVSAPPTKPGVVSIDAGTLGLDTAPAPGIAENWWTAFGDPQLDRLVADALQGSPSLASALARARQAQAALARNRSETYPQITFDAEEQRQRFSKNYIIPPPFGGSTAWVGTAQADLSWSLDVFGKQSAQIARARALATAAELDATAARLLLAGSVTQAYIALSRAYALMDAAEETARQQQSILSLTAARVEGGLENAASRHQSEALLAVARQELIRARSNRDLAVHQIAALTGRGAENYDLSRPDMKEGALALPNVLPADLLARRADIAAAKARVGAAISGRKAAQRAFYPDIDLKAMAGWAAIGLSPMFAGSAIQYGVGPAIHLPIFDAGKLRAGLSGATAELDQMVADYNETVVTAVKQTADSLTELQTLQEQEKEIRAALNAARRSFKLAQDRYQSGLSPQLNVLSAEDLLIQTRRQSSTFAADLASARVILLMSVGGGYGQETTASQTLTSVSQDK